MCISRVEEQRRKETEEEEVYADYQRIFRISRLTTANLRATYQVLSIVILTRPLVNLEPIRPFICCFVAELQGQDNTSYIRKYLSKYSSTTLATWNPCRSGRYQFNSKEYIQCRCVAI